MTNFINSAAKIAANLANSKKSTGPRTEAGKATSSKNAFKHGLASANLYVPAHLQPLYDEITNDLTQAILPLGTLEDDAFSQLRHARFQMERVLILQSELGQQSAARGLDPLDDPEVQKQWDRLQRYFQTAQSNFRANLKELRKLQSERSIRHEIFVQEAALPGLADYRACFNIGRQAMKLRENQAKAAIEAFIKSPTPGETH